jgi:hypothetical protein
MLQGYGVGEGVTVECTEYAFCAARLQTYYVTFIFPKDVLAVIQALLN